MLEINEVENEFVSKAFLYKGEEIGIRFINRYGDYIDVTYEQLDVNLGLDNSDGDTSIKTILHGVNNYHMYMKSSVYTGQYLLVYRESEIDDIVFYAKRKKDKNVLEINFGTYIIGLKNRARDKDLFQYASGALYGTGLFEAFAGIGSELCINESKGAVSFFIKSLRSDNEHLYSDKEFVKNILDDTIGRRFGIRDSYDDLVEISHFSHNDSVLIMVSFYNGILKYKNRIPIISIDSQCIDCGNKRIHYTGDGWYGVTVSHETRSIGYKSVYKTERINNRLPESIVKNYTKDVCRQVVVDSYSADKDTVLAVNLYLNNHKKYVYEFGETVLKDCVDSFESDLFQENNLVKMKFVRNKILFYKEYKIADDGIADNTKYVSRIVGSLIKDELKSVIGKIYSSYIYNYELEYLEKLITSFARKVNDRIVVGIKLDKEMVKIWRPLLEAYTVFYPCDDDDGNGGE